MNSADREVFPGSRLFAPGSGNISDAERRLHKQGHDVSLCGDVAIDGYSVLCRLRLYSQGFPHRVVEGGFRLSAFEQLAYLNKREAQENLTDHIHKKALDLVEELSQLP